MLDLSKAREQILGDRRLQRELLLKSRSGIREPILSSTTSLAYSILGRSLDREAPDHLGSLSMI
jgi:hypothetical protein